MREEKRENSNDEFSKRVHFFGEDKSEIRKTARLGRLMVMTIIATMSIRFLRKQKTMSRRRGQEHKRKR